MTSNHLPWAVVVDDDAELAETIADSLQMTGWDVTAFANSTTALSAILLRPPEVIFCDIEMPGINGVALASHVLRDLKHCKIVLMSGSRLPKEGETLIAQHSGRCRFFAKPVSMQTLRNFLTDQKPHEHGTSA